MSFSINAGNIDAIAQLLESGGAGADALGSLAGAAAGFLADSGLGLGASAFQGGTEGPDTLLGGDGADFLDARGGDDRAHGGSGDDFALGGDGADYLTGDGGAAAGAFPYPPAGDDILLGGAGDDTMFGDAFYPADHFGAKAGSNALFGGGGDDLITAGYGSDTVSGGDGDDVIRGWGVPMPGSGGHSARDGDLADLLLGGAGADTVEGGGGADTIGGGDGDDRLAGGVGNDALAGGEGADVFVFAFSGFSGFTPDTGRGEGNRDVVADFQSGVDVLDLTGYRSPGVTWAYDEAGDRVVVTIADPRGAQFPQFGPYEIELAGVRSLAAGDILV